MDEQKIEVTQVVETTGDKPFVTVLGNFLIIPDPAVPVGSRKTDGKSAFINPKVYEEIKGKGVTDIIRTIKGLSEVK